MSYSNEFTNMLKHINGLSADEKELLIDKLLDEESDFINIEESQKQLVLERVNRYNQHPERLILEETAIPLIKKM
jgi:hypothetical protein